MLLVLLRARVLEAVTAVAGEAVEVPALAPMTVPVQGAVLREEGLWLRHLPLRQPPQLVQHQVRSPYNLVALV